MLDRLERVNAAGRRQAREFAELELSDAVLGGNRTARSGDEIVDHARDRGALALVPVGLGVLGGANMEVDIAVAEVTEAARGYAAKGALHFGRRVDDEARHVGDWDRNVVREGLAFAALRFGDGVAEAPERIRLGLAGRDGSVRDDALLKSRA